MTVRKVRNKSERHHIWLELVDQRTGAALSLKPDQVTDSDVPDGFSHPDLEIIDEPQPFIPPPVSPTPPPPPPEVDEGERQ